MRIGSQIIWLISISLLVVVLEFFSLGGYRLARPVAAPFFLALILLIGRDTLWHGLKALATLNFSSINLLMVIAAAGAFALGQYEEAAVVIVLFNLSERLEDIGFAKSRSAIDRLVDKMPRLVSVKGEKIPIDISLIDVGAIICIKPSEMISFDGIVVSGISLIDESTITGEPLPQDKREGDTVFAGTLNKQGYLEIQVTQKAIDSTVAKIRDLTLRALQNKAVTQQFIERFSMYYTPAIMAAALAWMLGGWGSGELTFRQSFYEALSLLVIACPCALVISTPISLFSAIGNASSGGILIKGGRYLEALGNLKALAFDKTRTLTFGEPIVTDVIPAAETSRELLLGCAAGIEVLSEHPLAKGIVDAAGQEGILLHSVENFVSVVGKGAKADCLVCYDRHHCIGKLEFILEEHPVPPEIIRQIETLQNQGKTVIVISSHRTVKGVIALQDAVRPDSAPAISELHDLGIRTVMLTGDHRLSAQAVADRIGIGVVFADLLPQDKAAAIVRLTEEYGIVGMMGDGVNDAPALAEAHVGISMSTLGSDTALEAASVLILRDHLSLVPFLVRLGRRTLQTIRFNISLAVGVKVLVIALAVSGRANLALAVFADVGITLLVILNSLRLMQYK